MLLRDVWKTLGTFTVALDNICRVEEQQFPETYFAKLMVSNMIALTRMPLPTDAEWFALLEQIIHDKLPCSSTQRLINGRCGGEPFGEYCCLLWHVCGRALGYTFQLPIYVRISKWTLSNLKHQSFGVWCTVFHLSAPKGLICFNFCWGEGREVFSEMMPNAWQCKKVETKLVPIFFLRPSLSELQHIHEYKPNSE